MVLDKKRHAHESTSAFWIKHPIYCLEQFPWLHQKAQAGNDKDDSGIGYMSDMGRNLCQVM